MRASAARMPALDAIAIVSTPVENEPKAVTPAVSAAAITSRTPAARSSGLASAVPAANPPDTGSAGPADGSPAHSDCSSAAAAIRPAVAARSRRAAGSIRPDEATPIR